MVFKQLSKGMFSSNCYIIGDNGEGVVIDPGNDCGEILKAAESLGLSIKYIIATHSHIDHIVSLNDLRVKTGAKVLMHRSDTRHLSDAFLNGSLLYGMNLSFDPPDEFVEDGSVMQVGGLQLEIIHTPGHSPGGICIKTGNYLFTGDTLFKRSIGRTDLMYGNAQQLLNSIHQKLMKLPEDMVVYPGHGASTTIGEERRKNPWLQ